VKLGRIRLKLIADILTSIRFCLALLIAYVALTQGREGLLLALLLLLFGWITDMADGQLARRSPGAQRSWIGDNDIIVDVLLALSILIFFSVGGLLPLWITVAYLVYLVLATFVFTGWTMLAMFIGFSYGTSLLISLIHTPRFFIVFMVFIAFMLLTTWSHAGFKAIGFREPSKKA
jgi:cardiolipin synthase